MSRQSKITTSESDLFESFMQTEGGYLNYSNITAVRELEGKGKFGIFKSYDKNPKYSIVTVADTPDEEVKIKISILSPSKAKNYLTQVRKEYSEHKLQAQLQEVYDYFSSFPNENTKIQTLVHEDPIAVALPRKGPDNVFFGLVKDQRGVSVKRFTREGGVSGKIDSYSDDSNPESFQNFAIRHHDQFKKRQQTLNEIYDIFCPDHLGRNDGVNVEVTNPENGDKFSLIRKNVKFLVQKDGVYIDPMSEQVSQLVATNSRSEALKSGKMDVIERTNAHYVEKSWLSRDVSSLTRSDDDFQRSSDGSTIVSSFGTFVRDSKDKTNLDKCFEHMLNSLTHYSDLQKHFAKEIKTRKVTDKGAFVKEACEYLGENHPLHRFFRSQNQGFSQGFWSTISNDLMAIGVQSSGQNNAERKVANKITEINGELVAITQFDIDFVRISTDLDNPVTQDFSVTTFTTVNLTDPSQPSEVSYSLMPAPGQESFAADIKEYANKINSFYKSSTSLARKIMTNDVKYKPSSLSAFLSLHPDRIDQIEPRLPSLESLVTVGLGQKLHDSGLGPSPTRTPPGSSSSSLIDRDLPGVPPMTGALSFSTPNSSPNSSPHNSPGRPKNKNRAAQRLDGPDERGHLKSWALIALIMLGTL